MSDLFRELEPPPDGLQRLRARLDAESSRARLRRAAVPLAIAAAVLIAVLAWPRAEPQHPVAQLGLALLDPPTAAVQLRPDAVFGHVLEPVSASPEVVFVRIASVGGEVVR